MILVIILAGVFYRYAQKNNLSIALWTILSVLGYFAAQFIGVFVASLFMEMYQEDPIVIVISIASSLLFELILYLIMVKYGGVKKIQQSQDVLDDGS